MPGLGVEDQASINTSQAVSGILPCVAMAETIILTSTPRSLNPKPQSVNRELPITRYPLKHVFSFQVAWIVPNVGSRSVVLRIPDISEEQPG